MVVVLVGRSQAGNNRLVDPVHHLQIVGLGLHELLKDGLGTERVLESLELALVM